jgi:glycerol-1-phosphate dehydrogenase [NAD(P)+]
VAWAPSTRPDRYTILEHLDMKEGEVSERVRAYVETYGR